MKSALDDRVEEVVRIQAKWRMRLDVERFKVVTDPWASGRQRFHRGSGASVVSHHHQGIGRLAAGFTAWLEAPDGLIEGIRWDGQPELPFLVGVQYHPERSPTRGLLTDGVGLAMLEAAEAYQLDRAQGP